jgi:hypothetical protein
LWLSSTAICFPCDVSHSGSVPPPLTHFVLSLVPSGSTILTYGSCAIRSCVLAKHSLRWMSRCSRTFPLLSPPLLLLFMVLCYVETQNPCVVKACRTGFLGWRAGTKMISPVASSEFLAEAELQERCKSAILHGVNLRLKIRAAAGRGSSRGSVCGPASGPGAAAAIGLRPPLGS